LPPAAPPNPPLPSFPTRRSSDLSSATSVSPTQITENRAPCAAPLRTTRARAERRVRWTLRRPARPTTIHSRPRAGRDRPARRSRSEEHTSELQSRFDLVCRLLLE